MQENRKVDFKVFVWVVGVIMGVIGWLFAYVNNVSGRVDKFTNSFNVDMVSIQVQLSQIQTDILWIKERLK